MENWETVVDPPAGSRLSARATLNAWARRNLLLLGIATKTNDTCSGYSVGSTLYTSETEIYRATFRHAAFQSIKRLYHNITNSNGTIRIYIYDDTATWKKIYEGIETPPSSPLNYAFDTGGGSLSLTIGNHYQLKITLQGSLAASTMSYLAAQIATTTLWPTLATMASGVPTAADFAAVNAAQTYLKNIADAPMGASITVGIQSSYTGAPLVGTVRGGFVYHGQATFNITYRVNRTTTLTVYHNSGTDTLNLNTDGVEHSDTLALTTAQFTVGNFYTWETTHTNSFGTADAAENYIKHTWLSGTLSLTTTPFIFNEGDTVNGSSGTPRIKPTCGGDATDNLPELKLFLETTGIVPYGYQFLSPCAIGSVPISSIQSIVWSPAAVTRFRRHHQLRYLWYLPSSAGNAGQATYSYGGQIQTQALPDVTNTGAWNYLDTKTVPTLAYGQVLSIDNVYACFEASS